MNENDKDSKDEAVKQIVIVKFNEDSDLGFVVKLHDISDDKTETE
jgi:hypothetical protein